MLLSTRRAVLFGAVIASLLAAAGVAAQEPVAFTEPEQYDLAQYGASVAIDGDVMVVGVPASRLAGYTYGVGAAYVYRRTGVNEWELEASLLPDLPLPFGGVSFGASVAVDGDLMVIGAPYEWMHLDMGGDASVQGAAYIFRHVDGDWVRDAKVSAPPFAHPVTFVGTSVDVSGEVVVVGELGFSGGGPSGPSSGHFPCFDGQGATGGARVFTQVDGEWTEQLRLEPIDGRKRGLFGHSVAIDAERILVGAPWWWDEELCQEALANEGDPTSGTFRGQVYSYTFDGGAWVPEAQIAQPDPEDGDEFGFDVGLSVNRLIAGAPYSDEYGTRFGAAYTFTFDGELWTPEDSFVGFDTNHGDRFGMAVDVVGDQAVVGAPFHNNDNLNLGAMYAFLLVDGMWQEQLQVTIDADTCIGCPGPGWLNLGTAVAVGDGLYAAGAPADPREDGEPTGDRIGSAYVYTVDALFGSGVSTEPVATPGEIRLGPAYPNPARESVTIRFAVEDPTDITLSLFDVLGRRVAVLVEGEQQAGERTVSFRTAHLPAGVYLYRLEAAGQMKSGRFTVL